MVSFVNTDEGDQALGVNVRVGILLSGLTLLHVACTEDGVSDRETARMRVVRLLGPSCVPVGETAQLHIGASADANPAPPFRVVSVGCAPSCIAVLGEGNTVGIRSDLEGAATVQAVAVIDEDALPPQTVTTACVVQFVRSGACDADARVEW